MTSKFNGGQWWHRIGDWERVTKAVVRLARTKRCDATTTPTPSPHLPLGTPPGDHWFVDETSVKIAGRWVYLYCTIDQYSQVIDVLTSEKRNLAATRRFFTRALEHTHARRR